MSKPVQVGVVGVGYWGPNLVRNFSQVPGGMAKWAVDLREERLAHMSSLYPSLQTTSRVEDVFGDDDVDAVVIATPVSTHFPLAMRALEAGKHVFIEKPMAATSEECRKLIAEAKQRDLLVMVGHTFLYNTAVHRIKQLIDSGDLGQIFYVHITRVNLGLFQEDVNVVWDLAPHDVAILNWLLGSRPVTVNATGSDYVRPGIEDVAFINLSYPEKVRAHLHVSWLDPNKIRRITVVGSRRMLVYDDVSNTEKLRVYDKGVNVLPHYDTFGEFQLSYRYGDIVIPRIKDSEPLKNEAEHFVRCIREGTRPLSDGQNGLDVVEILETVNRSIRQGGAAIPVNGVGSLH